MKCPSCLAERGVSQELESSRELRIHHMKIHGEGLTEEKAREIAGFDGNLIEKKQEVLEFLEDNPDASDHEVAHSIEVITPIAAYRIMEGTDKIEETDASVAVPDDTEQEFDEGVEGSEEANEEGVLELSDIQKEVLWLIEEYPEASHKQLGEKIGLTGGAISSRVHYIKQKVDFEWEERREFVDGLFDEGGALEDFEPELELDELEEDDVEGDEFQTQFEDQEDDGSDVDEETCDQEAESDVDVSHGSTGTGTVLAEGKDESVDDQEVEPGRDDAHELDQKEWLDVLRACAKQNVEDEVLAKVAARAGGR